MRGDLFYASEKHWNALQILATSEGALRDRLKRAYLESAIFGRPHDPPTPSRTPMTNHLFAQIEAWHERMEELLHNLDALPIETIEEAAVQLLMIASGLEQENWHQDDQNDEPHLPSVNIDEWQRRFNES